VDNSKVSNMT